MKTDISIPNSIEPELAEMEFIDEFNVWDIASDEALENFEKGLEML